MPMNRRRPIQPQIRLGNSSGPGLAEELRPLGALYIGGWCGGLWGGEVAKGRKLLPSALLA